MNDMRFSPLLEELFYRARSVVNTGASLFTAETLLIAAIDKVVSGEADNGEELVKVRICMQNAFGDLNVMKNSLLMQISKQSGASFSDEMYLRLKIGQAKEAASQANSAVITADVLINCIASDPTNAIRIARSLGVGATSATGKGQGNDLIEQLMNALGANGAAAVAASDTTKKSANGATSVDGQATSAQTAKKKEELASLVSKIKEYQATLKSEIFGQDHAINVFTTGYFQAMLNAMTETKRRRPLATYLFAGPPGVGKTFLAETVASDKILDLPFERFDMSEYSHKDAVIQLVGSDNVWKDSHEGRLTSFVEQNPKCILLFDEIEKAHLAVIHLFLQMLDAGILQDANTKKNVSFADTIIIMTTNAGKQLYEESDSGDYSCVSRKVILDALQKDIDPLTKEPFFPAAICSRFATGNVVMFNHISAHDLQTIAKKKILESVENIRDEIGIHVEVDEQVYAALLFSEGCAADARTISSRAKAFLNDELYELFRLVSSDKIHADISKIENVRLKIDLSKANDEVLPLFKDSEKTQIVVFADPDTVAYCRNQLPDHEIVGARSAEEAVGLMKKREMDFALIDMKCGIREDAVAHLNVEDVESEARDFFKFLKERYRDLPIYLLESASFELSDEEKMSFVQQGVRGTVCLHPEEDVPFAQQVNFIAAALYRQVGMDRLARENKLMIYETSQTVSEDGKSAEINMFDFKLIVAVDSEDAKDIIGAVSRPDVKFDDVIGGKDAKKELMYFVQYLKNPKKYMGTGVKAPKGVLLYGPPGTGKTMLAKAMASESNVTFIAAEGNKFRQWAAGSGSKMVHDIFRKARKYAPSILFIDEIDAIAKERTGHDTESEATLTAFLAEMDGFVNDPSKPVFVLAATNFDVEPGGAKSLDPALMRRFDRRVYIDLPAKDDRILFLNKKIQKNEALQISQAQVNNIAIRSTGMSLAELDSVVELSLRSAIREGSTVVTDAILEEAFETFNNGEEKGNQRNLERLTRTARHEAGHAFLYWVDGNTPSYMTIVARGHHGGYMQHDSNEDKTVYTREDLVSLIRTSLGGRAAEIVYYGEKDGLTTGASSDLAHATVRAQRIICSYGMDAEFGLAVIDNNSLLNAALSGEVRKAVNKLLDEQMQEAVRLIAENKAKIDKLVEVLLLKTHLTGPEIDGILSD